MGASSSSPREISEDEKYVEYQAASTGCLPMLRDCFSKLSDPNTNAIPLKCLQECFSLKATTLVSEGFSVPICLQQLLVHLGSAIVEDFFLVDNGGVSWVAFLRGYIRCCGRVSSSVALKALYKLFITMSLKVGLVSRLEIWSDDSDTGIYGYLLSRDVLMFLWICWIMSMNSKVLESSEQNDRLVLPNINHVLCSALGSCCEEKISFHMVDSDISGFEVPVPAKKFHIWALAIVPGLSHCLAHYVHHRLQNCAAPKNKGESSFPLLGSTSFIERGLHSTQLLTCGRAWAISLTLGTDFNEALGTACCPGRETESLLYRSSIDGRGLSRFWYNIEGYNAQLLILISSSLTASNGESHNEEWVIGVLTQQGFLSKNGFYGSSGYLYAISPIFHVFPPTGKDKNFVYSHLCPSRLYEPHPMPVGLGFGGTIGNQRIFVDEDLSKITFRHHSVDKTYQAGPLFPNQGFLPTEASVMEVEVWGLGGKSAKEGQIMHQKRESLFSKQRRKVDLNSFRNWEESPEKIMIDMMGDPNRVKREER